MFTNSTLCLCFIFILLVTMQCVIVWLNEFYFTLLTLVNERKKTCLGDDEADTVFVVAASAAAAAAAVCSCHRCWWCKKSRKMSLVTDVEFVVSTCLRCRRITRPAGQTTVARLGLAIDGIVPLCRGTGAPLRRTQAPLAPSKLFDVCVTEKNSIIAVAPCLRPWSWWLLSFLS